MTLRAYLRFGCWCALRIAQWAFGTLHTIARGMLLLSVLGAVAQAAQPPEADSGDAHNNRADDHANTHCALDCPAAPDGACAICDHGHD